ncbi:MAG: hypothetical protein OIF57_08920 [Marinobacterium sp.]|nr:hypothetical protein [Marinobacterium sp.]
MQSRKIITSILGGGALLTSAISGAATSSLPQTIQEMDGATTLKACTEISQMFGKVKGKLDPQKQRSTFAWCLFATVNSPYNGEAGSRPLWQTWASNENTFLDEGIKPKWPTESSSDIHEEIKKRTIEANESKSPQNDDSERVDSKPSSKESVYRNKITFDYLSNINPMYSQQVVKDTYRRRQKAELPLGSIEVKAHWVRDGHLTSWGQELSINKNKDNDKMISAPSDSSYYLNGMHIMIKSDMLPGNESAFTSQEKSWFWTTFEYVNNPGRTQALKFVKPKTAKNWYEYHNNRQLLKKVQAKMPWAQNLDPKFIDYYRSNGTQLSFFEDKEVAVLGNTTMEDFAFQPTPETQPENWVGWTTSCHTCHAQARTPIMPASLMQQGGFVPAYGPLGPVDPDVVNGAWPLDFIWSIPLHAK